MIQVAACIADRNYFGMCGGIEHRRYAVVAASNNFSISDNDATKRAAFIVFHPLLRQAYCLFHKCPFHGVAYLSNVNAITKWLVFKFTNLPHLVIAGSFLW